MKHLILRLFSLSIISLGSWQEVSAQEQRAVPPEFPENATKKPSTTRDPNVTDISYFLPDQEPSEKSRIGIETFRGRNLIKRELFKDGKIHGVQREWYPEGGLKSESPYEKGEMNGTFKVWSSGGQLIAWYSIEKGVGMRTVYDPKGVLVMECGYASGEKNGLCFERMESGELVILRFAKGLDTGLSYGFFPSGAVSGMIFGGDSSNVAGPAIEFSEKGAVAHISWHLNGRELREEEYGKRAAADPKLPPYHKDPLVYKTMIEKDVLELVSRVLKMPPVKIPLEFDAAGNPVPR